jgi:aryl-alcohol dehydrogenase-like predicted oxidoreductase
MKRRSFLKVVGGATSLAAVNWYEMFGDEASRPVIPHASGLPRRVLGRTKQEISIVGFPGLALSRLSQEESNAAARKAYDQGCNYFDVAPAYGDAEVKMGPALDGWRDKVFLACKTKMRDAKGAREELERSLQRLKTDHFDLYQMHHIRTPAEVKQALGPGGALETFLKAKEEGKVKAFGFSAHTTKGALELMKGFRFDTAMFPINFVEYFVIDFGKPILSLAKEQGVAVLAIKPLSAGAWPEGAQRKREWWYPSMETPEGISLAWRFTLSLEPVISGIPPSFVDLFEKSVTAAKAYQPATEAEVTKLRELAAKSASLFKREEDAVATAHYDYRHRPLHPGSPHENRYGGYA